MTIPATDLKETMRVLGTHGAAFHGYGFHTDRTSVSHFVSVAVGYLMLSSATCFPFLWAALRTFRSLAASTTLGGCALRQRFRRRLCPFLPLDVRLVDALLSDRFI